MPRFDTSFNFGANATGGGKTGKKSKTVKKRRKGGGKSAAKTRSYFAARYGS